MSALKTFSYGGGQQSTAALVLAARDELGFRPDAFLFADPGDEYPETMTYLHEFAFPFAEAHGQRIEVLVRQRKDGSRETLRDRLEAGRMAIPVRRSKDGPPMSRSCTADFKIAVIEKWLKQHGATKGDPALVGLGISADELSRAHGEGEIDPLSPVQRRTYPLIRLGLTRADCQRIIEEAGLPIPPSSACTFCPMHNAERWRALKRNHPEQFEDACRIEEKLSANTSDGKPVYMTRRGIPLREVFSDDQLQLFGGDDCESGYCMT